MSLAIEHDAALLEPVHTPPTGARLARVLVATRGEPACAAALRTAAAITAHEAAVLEAVTVFAPAIPLPPEATDAGGRFVCERRDRPAAARLLRRARRQYRTILGSRAPMHHFVAGDPPQAIAEAAQDAGADLIVCGLGRDDPAHRALGSLTAARLAVLSDVPVLSVASFAGELPRHAVAHAESPREALVVLGTAAHVLAPDASVTLVRLGRLEPWNECDWRLVQAWWRAVRGAAASTLRLRDVDAPQLDANTELAVVPVPGGSSPVRSLMSGRVLKAFQTARCSVLTVPVDVLRAARGHP